MPPTTDAFRLSLVTPQSQVLDADATYASIPAWDGQVGIAPMRAPLLVKLGDGLLRVDLVSGGSKWFFIAGGFAQVKDNKLSLVTSEAVTPEDVDRQTLAAALREAEAEVAIKDEEVAARQRRINRAKALLSLPEHAAAKG